MFGIISLSCPANARRNDMTPFAGFLRSIQRIYPDRIADRIGYHCSGLFGRRDQSLIRHGHHGEQGGGQGCRLRPSVCARPGFNDSSGDDRFHRSCQE